MREGTAINKLLSISSEALGPVPKSMPGAWQSYPLASALFHLLQQKNGFYAFEQALHILPLESDITGKMTLEEWNSETLWKSAYKGMTNGLLFFGEDVFGDQFCLSKSDSGVFHFDAEYGSANLVAPSMEKWAELISSDYEAQTGWRSAHEWQAEHGPLGLGQRVQPKIPFSYGGDYSLQNLWAGDAVKGMLFKAEVALKVRDLPAGTELRLEVGKKGTT